MDVHIRLTIDAPEGWKRRVLLYVASPLAFVLAGVAVARAGTPLDLSWIQSGQPVPASSMSAALSALDARLAQLESPSIYAGKTSTALDGLQVGGYVAADTKCGLELAGSHLCDPSELLRSVSGHASIPPGWYRTGLYAAVDAGGNPPEIDAASDCLGWTSNGATNYGPAWTAEGHGWVSSCAETLPLLCCK